MVWYITLCLYNTWFGIGWYGIVWYGIVRRNMIWYRMAWYGMALYGTWCGIGWHGMALYSTTWFGIEWHGMALYDTTWCGIGWHGMARHFTWSSGQRRLVLEGDGNGVTLIQWHTVVGEQTRHQLGCPSHCQMYLLLKCSHHPASTHQGHISSCDALPQTPTVHSVSCHILKTHNHAIVHHFTLPTLIHGTFYHDTLCQHISILSFILSHSDNTSRVHLSCHTLPTHHHGT